MRLLPALILVFCACTTADDTEPADTQEGPCERPTSPVTDRPEPLPEPSPDRTPGWLEAFTPARGEALELKE